MRRLIKLPQLVLNTALALGGLALSATGAHAQTAVEAVPPSSIGTAAPPAATPPAAPSTLAPAPPPTPDGTHVEVDVPPAAPTGAAVPLPETTEVPDQNAVATTNANIYQVPVEPLPPLTPPGYSSARPYVPNRIGGALMVGGGYEDFTNSTLNNMTSGAGAWNARVVAGTRQFVGLEAAYVGAARNIDALGLSNDATLISNGVEGNVRVNIPIVRQVSMIEPFGFVGLGWSHYHVGNTQTRTSDLAANDDVMTVPLGAGLEYSYKAFIADARFTYRPTY